MLKIKKIRSLQKKAVRIVCNGNVRAHSDPIFSRLDWTFKIWELIKINVQSFMYIFFLSKLPLSDERMFTDLAEPNRTKSLR